MKQAHILLLIFSGFIIGVVTVLWTQSLKKEAHARLSEETPNIVWRQNHFLLNRENVLNELKAQDIKFPEVVLAQAILETGHFKSHACLQQNNLFGLRRRDSTYMTFQHWTESVTAYKKYIQKWEQPPKDYFNYLDSLGYAENKAYIRKLKQMIR